MITNLDKLLFLSIVCMMWMIIFLDITVDNK